MTDHGPPDPAKLDNPIGKIRFVTDLCNAIRDDAIAKVRDMPAEWNGIELREYLADKFDHERVSHPKSRHFAKRSKRYKDYRSSVYSYNL